MKERNVFEKEHSCAPAADFSGGKEGIPAREGVRRFSGFDLCRRVVSLYNRQNV
jgi:hypothetical protein